MLRKYLATSSYAYTHEFDPNTYTNKALKTLDYNQVLFFEKDIKRRIEHFKEVYKNSTWLSWNYPDWQTRQYLIKNEL